MTYFLLCINMETILYDSLRPLPVLMKLPLRKFLLYVSCFRQEESAVKNVIEEIARLDAQAFENERKNRSAIFQQRQKYENEIKRYRENKIKEANEKAKAAYDEVIEKAQREYREKEAEMEQRSELLEKQYLKVESKVLDTVFQKLFSV